MTINRAPFPLRRRRVLLLADGEFSVFGAKTAVCYLRYRPQDVVAVLDRSRRGMRAEEAVGLGGDIPIVAGVEEAMRFDPEVAIVGVAPAGGQLTTPLREQILDCVGRGIDVVSGLHSFLNDEKSITAAAHSSGARLWDVRRVDEMNTVSTGRGCTTGAHTVMVAGTDCNVGKMTATIQLHDEALRRGVDCAWAATGQTGMMLRGRGVAIDRVVADFVGGAAEALVNYEGRGKRLLFVEGQGSLVHPGYGGVTLGLLLGVMPDCQVLVHGASRTRIGDTDTPMPPLLELIALYESLMRPFKPSPVVAIALNTAGLDSAAAGDMLKRVEAATGLPVADPVRSGAGRLMDAVAGALALVRQVSLASLAG